MTIHWAALLSVFVVSFVVTIAVVALVAVAVLGLSDRSARAASAGVPTRGAAVSPASGTTLAVLCLAMAAGIVLFGLWEIVAR